ncbi:MAG: TRAM domain-containing protein [Acidobacteria bacterium]|nr:TRAM domain-containing protein [Acidobacteriota bacterium]
MGGDLMQIGTEITLVVEKPVAGGRMLARHEGRVVLVSGTIPGERVVARVERVQSQLAQAATIAVLEPHAARRDDNPDPACGGMTYAHIAYDHQRHLKALVVADAFARQARVALDPLPPVAASPERGYRMRTRLHVRGGRIGSFREGSHDLCDIAVTGQVLPETVAVLRDLEAGLSQHGVERLEAVEVMENLDATQRVLHFDDGPARERLGRSLLDRLAALPGVTGVSHARGGRRAGAAARVGDRLDAFTGPGTDAGDTLVGRQAQAFFQANRFLTPPLVQAVLARLEAGPVVDLYAGVGLFAMAAAAAGLGPVVAVEGDEVSATDLVANVAPLAGRVTVVHAAVETFLARRRDRPIRSLIVDPPRTGMSREAMAGVLSAGARRLVYVSCDVATLARDARRLLDTGYDLASIEAFDLFPNTPHVEVLAVFDRQA